MVKLAYNENDDKYYVSVPLLCSPLCCSSPPESWVLLSGCALVVWVACRELELCWAGRDRVRALCNRQAAERVADLPWHFLAMKQVT